MATEIEKLKDDLYVKKSKFGYRIVYPIRKEDNSLNWFNILTGGSWGNFIKLLAIVVVIIVVSYSYYHDVKACYDVIANPCEYCYPIRLTEDIDTSLILPVSLTLGGEIS